MRPGAPPAPPGGGGAVLDAAGASPDAAGGPEGAAAGGGGSAPQAAESARKEAKQTVARFMANPSMPWAASSSQPKFMQRSLRVSSETIDLVAEPLAHSHRAAL